MEKGIPESTVKRWIQNLECIVYDALTDNIDKVNETKNALLDIRSDMREMGVPQ